MKNDDVIYDSDTQIYNLSSRFFTLFCFLIFFFFVLLVRLWHLQIIQGDVLKVISVKNRVKQKKIMSPRGYILDREGRVLVDNNLVSQLTVNLQGLDAKEKEVISQKVGAILNLNEKQIQDRINKSIVLNGRYFPAVIADNLTIDESYALKLLRIDHPLINIEEFIYRSYPFGASGSQLYGYVSQVSKNQLDNKEVVEKNLVPGDMIGKKGVEKKWDSIIRGKDGLTYVQVDAHGRVTDIEENILESSNLDPIQPQSGDHLVLTIDMDIQEAATKAFQRTDAIGPRIGALVALNNKGEVLAWVSEPSFDSNQFLYGISNENWKTLIQNPFKPLRNKVIQDNFSPGSTFKPFVGIAALEKGVITPTTLIDSPGFFQFGRRKYHNHTKNGHGLVNISTALETSSNVFFYKIALELGIDEMAKYARAFGLGQVTDVGLDTENPGLIPDSAWKLKTKKEVWQKGEDIVHSVGAGFIDVTPLQMALAYMAIANEGPLYHPLIVKKILKGSDQKVVLKEFKPQLVRDLSKENADGFKISKETFQAIKKGFYLVGNGDRGTAKWYKIPNVPIAGKTGTAQVRSWSEAEIYKSCENRPITDRHHGWFVGYAPADEPEIFVSVLTMHSCHGSSGSAPVARDVIEAYMRKYHPEKFKTAAEKEKIVGL
jgi:penicillin-binding protein 2